MGRGDMPPGAGALGVVAQSVAADTATTRIASLFDTADFHAVPGATAQCARAVLNGHAAAVFATDANHARGALGAADCEALIWSIGTAVVEGLPMVWLLDSAGAKVDEGLPALSAFRRCYRAAMKARAAGTPLLALLGRGCWGGASLLAMLAEQRIFSPQTRFATSGPAIIESVEGKSRFHASDNVQVDGLLGAQARIAVDARGSIAEPARHRDILAAWLSRSAAEAAPVPAIPQPSLHTAAAVDQRGKLQSLLPPAYCAQQRDNIVFALPPDGTGKAVFCGYLGGGAVGAADCWTMLQCLDAITASHPGSPLVLVLDASGHAATIADERSLLARYLTALSQRIMALGAAGHRVALWIPGRASGAVYVAFAAAVDTVSVLPLARVEVLGAKAVDSILGRAVAGASSAQELVALGIAEGILDERLNGYHAA